MWAGNRSTIAGLDGEQFSRDGWRECRSQSRAIRTVARSRHQEMIIRIALANNQDASRDQS